MARAIEYTDAAFADLEAIVYFGALNFGPAAALAYRGALLDAAKLIAAFPESAPVVHGLPGAPSGAVVRMRTVRSHRIAYLVTPGDAVRVLRILHARQAPPELGQA